MENSQLHDDMLIEIFSRLPAKSVGKFRCLSKAWCTHLSSSRFINLHFTIRKTNQSQLFLGKHGISFYVWTPRNEDPVATTKIDLPFTLWSGVVNSCNGLVLLWDTQHFILVNPITLQHVLIPIPKLPLHRCGLGFGYDSCSNDYKIVIYNWCAIVGSSTLDVYSVKSEVWKRVSSSPKHPITDEGSGYKGVFTNGAIHWIAVSTVTCIIVAFSLADEVFYYIPLPASPRDWRIPYLRIYVLEGCLCVTDTSGSLKTTDIWLMKEYNVEDSWTRFTVNHHGIYRPLCFIREQEIVLLTSFRREVIVYDLVRGTTKDMIVDGDYSDGVAFSESLVSLSSRGGGKYGLGRAPVLPTFLKRKRLYLKRKRL